MRFSLRLNNDLPVADYIVLAQAAERAGFDQFWVSNDLFLRSAPVILAAVAQATTRIHIGSCILNPYTVHPAEIAMFAATMDELSGNRFNLGLAAGAGEFLKWVGIEQHRPLRMMRETIIAIRALLRGERVAFDGECLHWTNEAYLRFRAPRVTPIYLGAMSAGMLRLAGELCDGVLPLLFPPEHYFEVRQIVSEGARKREAPPHPSPLPQGRGNMTWPRASGSRSMRIARRRASCWRTRSRITATHSARSSTSGWASRAMTFAQSNMR